MNNDMMRVTMNINGVAKIVEVTQDKYRANIIKNDSIKKLTRDEICCFGFHNYGIFCYKGELKTRVRGCKTTVKTETERHYENDSFRFEFINIQTEINKRNPEGENEWAYRMFNKETGMYEIYISPISACEFIR